ncbi:MAG: hypothetical protein HS104_38840 [Polyangiaceae bacterium]|nr:hypothetical protein [Polyangiaceae bacterium]MCE7888650.1 hypothetical protein [Sorangiineae bacterium PRO1]MCL4754833.1 hypothetical protein [Myxococcales bacterium]
MTGSNTFEWLCAELEVRTALSKLEARGTVRLVLKDVGLDPATVSPHQMHVVLLRLLAPALAKRKVEDADALCKALAEEVEAIGQHHTEPDEDTAYAVFDRLESDTTRRGRK